MRLAVIAKLQRVLVKRRFSMSVLPTVLM